jgi:hypothetical protein
VDCRADLDLMKKKYLASARNPIPQLSKPIAWPFYRLSYP